MNIVIKVLGKYYFAHPPLIACRLIITGDELNVAVKLLINDDKFSISP